MYQTSSLKAPVDSNLFLLSTIVSELDIQADFERTAADVFLIPKPKSLFTIVFELLKYIILECKAFAQLAISVMQIDNKEAFETFFPDVCVSRHCRFVG